MKSHHRQPLLSPSRDLPSSHPPLPHLSGPWDLLGSQAYSAPARRHPRHHLLQLGLQNLGLRLRHRSLVSGVGWRLGRHPPFQDLMGSPPGLVALWVPHWVAAHLGVSFPVHDWPPLPSRARRLRATSLPSRLVHQKATPRMGVVTMRTARKGVPAKKAPRTKRRKKRTRTMQSRPPKTRRSRSCRRVRFIFFFLLLFMPCISD